MASWTSKENKLFENALQIYTEDTPERWEKLAGALGNTKTAQQVKLHYEKLVEDIMAIERGAIPLPKYKKNPSKSNSYDCMNDQQKRKENLTSHLEQDKELEADLKEVSRRSTSYDLKELSCRIKEYAVENPTTNRCHKKQFIR